MRLDGASTLRNARAEGRQRLLRPLPWIVILLATTAVFAVLQTRAGATSPAPVPPRGGLAVTIADHDHAGALASAQPYAVSSVSILDAQTSRFLVFIPGAPAIANTLDPAELPAGAVVWLRRSERAGGPEASAGAPVAAPAAAATEATFSSPAPGGLTSGVVHASSLQELIAAQAFPVDSVFVWDMLAQEYRRYRMGAPAHANTLDAGEIAPGTIAVLRREAAADVGPAPSPPPIASNAPASPTPSVTAEPAVSPTTPPTPVDAVAARRPAPVAASNEACQAVPADRLELFSERVGFAAHVTGGATGCVYHVTNGRDSGPGSLRAGAEAGNRWVVFDDDFTITLETPIQVAANTTIDGRGRSITITRRGLYLSSTSQHNVILENLTLREITGKGHDAVRAWDGASDFWFDHLTIEDVRDEYIDIGRTNRGRSTPVNGTVSFVRFNQGSSVNTDEKALIIGAPAGADTNHLIQVTLHHNYYNGTRQRHPLAAGAKVHSFNNVIRWRLWGAQARREGGAAKGAQIVSEGDVFDASMVHSDHAQYGVRLVNNGTRVRVSDALLLDGASVEQSEPEQAFVPPYHYARTSSDQARSTVPAAAGAQ